MMCRNGVRKSEIDQKNMQIEMLEGYFDREPVFSIILVHLFCMHVMHVCLDSSGFINGNGFSIAQACPISIIPWSVKASKK